MYVCNGLQLPSLSTTYKRCQISRYHLLLTSTDDHVRRLAEMQSNQFNARRSIKFNPFKYISMCSNSSLSGKSLPKSSDKAKQLVQKADNQLRFERAKSCVVQGATFRLPSLENDDTWSLTVLSFSDRVFSFSLNAIQDTLPHNVNLVKWGKTDSATCPLCGGYQSLLHCLNNCSTALADGRYTWRHNSVLQCIFGFLKNNLLNGWSVTADLPGLQYQLPAVLDTSLRPDIAVWCNSSRMLKFFLTDSVSRTIFLLQVT